MIDQSRLRILDRGGTPRALGTAVAISVVMAVVPKAALAAAVTAASPRTLRLVAGLKRFDINGKKVWGESYNGDYTGPTIASGNPTVRLVNCCPACAGTCW